MAPSSVTLPDSLEGWVCFWGDSARIFFFHSCLFFFFFFFSRTPADLLDKMLLILLGVLVLHLIILILLIVSTAASVSKTPRSLKRGEGKKNCAPELHDNDLELRFKIAGRCSFEIAVLLFVPDLDCRWRQNQRSLVQLPDVRRRLPLQAGQR